MVAVMTSWRSTSDQPNCVFLSRHDDVLTGRKHTTNGDKFVLDDSEYADDAGVLFPTRHSLATETPKLIHHFERFGMEIHLGNSRTEKASKSEILFAAKPRIMYDDPDTYDGADLSKLDLGNGLFIPIVAEFVYLGSTISRECTDEAEDECFWCTS